MNRRLWARTAWVAVIIMYGLVASGRAQPAIWQLSDDDSEVYLFGTVHILPPDMEWRTDAIDRAFEVSGTVWFEAPATDPAAQAETLRLVQQYGLNAPGNPLSSQISSESLEKLQEVAASTGLPAVLLEPMRPWLASVTLSATYIQAQGFQPESGVESILWPEAEAAGKALAYFETLEEQVRFFADLPPDIEVGYFEQTLTEFDDAAGELDELVSAWAAGDVATIDRIMNDEARESAPEVYDRLIIDRNIRWVERIDEVLAGSGTHFIAVGAGHIAGPKGIAELLRERGYTVVGP